MRKDLSLPFTLLSDSDRATIIEWGVLNANEKGGIAIPSTFLIDRERKVRFASVEDMMMRVEPRAMLDFMRAMPAGDPARSAPAWRKSRHDVSTRDGQRLPLRRQCETEMRQFRFRYR